MARPSVFPLPDACVRHIVANVDALQGQFPPDTGNRPFLAAFIALVREATGEVFGASTYRKLLKLYAPDYRPSTPTIQAEIESFKAKAERPASTAHWVPDGRPCGLASRLTTPEAALDLAQADVPNGIGTSAELPGVLAGLERLIEQVKDQRAIQAGAETFHTDALVRTLEAENERLRAHNEYLQDRLTQFERQKDAENLELTTLRAQKEQLEQQCENLTRRITELAQAFERAQAQVDSSHKFALGRIEDATGELRRYKDQHAIASNNIEVLKKKLEDERMMTDTLRRALVASKSAMNTETGAP